MASASQAESGGGGRKPPSTAARAQALPFRSRTFENFITFSCRNRLAVWRQLLMQVSLAVWRQLPKLILAGSWRRTPSTAQRAQALPFPFETGIQLHNLMQESPSGMASASQADSGGFDSRFLLQIRAKNGQKCLFLALFLHFWRLFCYYIFNFGDKIGGKFIVLSIDFWKRVEQFFRFLAQELVRNIRVCVGKSSKGMSHHELACVVVYVAFHATRVERRPQVI